MEKPTEYSLTWEVTDEMTAKRIGSAGSKILSTPNMVALMEAAALELAKAYLDEGMTTVGAEIHCRHLAPTPCGASSGERCGSTSRCTTRRASAARAPTCASWWLPRESRKRPRENKSNKHPRPQSAGGGCLSLRLRGMNFL